MGLWGAMLPENEATGISIGTGLDWGYAGLYLLFNHWCVYWRVAGGGGFSSEDHLPKSPSAYNPSGDFLEDTTYEWYIEAHNADCSVHSSSYDEDGYYTFTTVGLPEKPINPSPANAATNVTLDQSTITWEDGGGATSYNVYYGENEAGLTLVSEGQAGLSFTISGITYGSPFNYVISRTWRIDAINESGTTTGDVWVFTTIKLAPPLPTGLSLDSGGGNEGTGTTGTATGENNTITIKKLVVAANSKIWYENI